MSSRLSRVGLTGRAGRTGKDGGDAPAQRPEGPLIWVHATSTQRLDVLSDLAGRLKVNHGEIHVLATFDAQTCAPDITAVEGCDWVLPLHVSTQSEARQFVTHWRPGLALWTGSTLQPTAIRIADEAGVPLILVDADGAGFEGGRRSWFKDPVRQTLLRFARVLSVGPSATAALIRLGLPPGRVETAVPMRLGPSPAAFPEDDIAQVAEELSGRPSWLAAHIHPEEFGTVLTAHRAALRLSHRMLLVIVLDAPQYRPDLLDLLEGMTLRHAVWQLGDPIGDNLQVLVVDDPDDLGLWYRTSPQSFLGHSLVPGETGRSPLEASALGSAVLHGPNVGDHTEAYARLASAGAARLVGDGSQLGSEVAQLLAPEKAAAMALAGWEVVTEGAALTDRLLALILQQLDLVQDPDESA